MTKLCPFRKSGLFHTVNNVYYVDATGGDDEAAGTSEGTAWKTLAKVAATTFAADDEIRFKRGETWAPGGTFVCPSQGTLGHPIWLCAYGTGADPFLNVVVQPIDYLLLRDLKVGVDAALGFGRSGGASHVTHHVTCYDVTFLGGVVFTAGSVSVDGGFHDALFQGCTFLTSPSSTVYNSVNLYVYGSRPGNTHYNIDFNKCVWEGALRINAEITCYSPGDPVFDFAYPWRNINFYDCDFGPSGWQSLSICGRRSGYYTAPFSGAFECGYGTVSGCYIEDAGVTAEHMAVEIGGTAHYTFSGNVVGRNRQGAVTGSHLYDMIDVNADSTNHSWRDGYVNDQYNAITNNIFDGSASAASTFTCKGSYLAFSGNTVIQQVCQGFFNCTDSSITGNDISTVDADGVTLSSTKYALWWGNCDTIAVEGNTFRSKYDYTVRLSDWYGSDPATNIAFVDNTFVKDAGDSRILVVSGSSKTESGSVDVVA